MAKTNKVKIKMKKDLVDDLIGYELKMLKDNIYKIELTEFNNVEYLILNKNHYMSLDVASKYCEILGDKNGK